MSHFFRNRFVYTFLGIELAVVALGAIFYFTVLSEKRVLLHAPDFNEYPLLDRYENVYKPFHGVVTDIENHSGISFVTLNNGEKFSIDRITHNIACDPSQLSSFIRVGDSIAKPEEDFIFFVYRKKIRYSFKIKESIRSTPVDTRTNEKIIK